VPRYYFNFCSDEVETTDLVGEDCADDVAALKEALKAASHALKEQLFFNNVMDGWIEVEDERHREVMRLPLRAAAY
jgi:tRNA A-37 threonylcarbamoyl transferase component Bud32